MKRAGLLHSSRRDFNTVRANPSLYIAMRVDPLLYSAVGLVCYYLVRELCNLQRLYPSRYLAAFRGTQLSKITT